MTEKKQPTPEENEPKPEAAASEELSEEQLEHVAGGALNAYLKLGAAPGESTSDGHTGVIPIESFSIGAALPTNPLTIKK